MSFDQKLAGLLGSLRASIDQHQFIKLSLGHYKGKETTLKSIHIRMILIKNTPKLSFTYRHQTKDIVQNYDITTGLEKIADNLGALTFLTCTLTTADQTWFFDASHPTKVILRSTPNTDKKIPALDHDRTKKRPLTPRMESYLYDLGITDCDGQVLKSAQDKYRQINRYIEILSGLLNSLPNGQLGQIVDMGSGKGYLTFALYDYLVRNMGYAGMMTGLEQRQDLVDFCNKTAQKHQLKNLHFVHGSIADYTQTNGSQLSVLIALHACNTATDDAIAKGIENNADLIVVAPCCHKQIRQEIEQNKAKNDLGFVLRHGIFMERQAEMVTDALRALYLRYCSYETKVFEFVSDAHTAKNVMIVGTKNPRISGQKASVGHEIAAAKAYFGINTHYLEKALGIEIP